ncbi:hypothetical protein M0812_01894 [Anaeramoeba flamelloides]|uniref:Uncharacterized protein n=1 Tax=Anaeramoeba flamelloides TaxID=1746091 RepID=A0AAV7YYC9_9EUKA|nr:hypothetical protein M0812_01894 [Anaeramoeba flamelloides]
MNKKTEYSNEKIIQKYSRIYGARHLRYYLIDSDMGELIDIDPQNFSSFINLYSKLISCAKLIKSVQMQSSEYNLSQEIIFEEHVPQLTRVFFDAIQYEIDLQMIVKIISYFILNNHTLSTYFINKLLKPVRNYYKKNSNSLAFLSILQRLLLIEDELQKLRIEMIMSELFQISQIISEKSTKIARKFIRRLFEPVNDNLPIKRWFQNNKMIIKRMCKDVNLVVKF